MSSLRMSASHVERRAFRSRSSDSSCFSIWDWKMGHATFVGLPLAAQIVAQILALAPKLPRLAAWRQTARCITHDCGCQNNPTPQHTHTYTHTHTHNHACMRRGRTIRVKFQGKYIESHQGLQVVVGSLRLRALRCTCSTHSPLPPRELCSALTSMSENFPAVAPSVSHTLVANYIKLKFKYRIK